MRIENTPLTAVTLDSSANSEAFWVGHAALFAVQIVVTGTAPTGTFTIQGSCDPGKPNAQSKTSQATITNWSDTSTTLDITATGTYLLNVADPGYQWARIKWTNDSGTGSAAIRCTTKGV